MEFRFLKTNHGDTKSALIRLRINTLIRLRITPQSISLVLIVSKVGARRDGAKHVFSDFGHGAMNLVHG